MTNLLCIYHAHCDDGFGAAWAVRHAFGDKLNPLSSMDGIDFHPATHGGQPPDVKGRMVLMVDFVYPSAVMDRLMLDCDTLVVLDHHKSSMLDMVAWAKPLRHVVIASQNDGQKVSIQTPKAKLVFDMTRSGAMMAWDHYHAPEAPLFLYHAPKAPLFIHYIQDHDLWTKKLPGIDEFTAALRSYPMDFETWDKLTGFNTGHGGIIASRVDALITMGRDILRYKNQLVDIAVKNSFWVDIEVPGYGLVVDNEGSRPASADIVTIRGANVPPAISSEVGEALALKYGGQSLTWIEGFPKWTYGLRSRAVGDKPAPDVSLIAVAMGGGGHAQAAGFKTTGAVHKAVAKEES